MAEKEICAYCEQEMQPVTDSWLYFYFLSGEKKKVVVKNIPAQYCTICDETYFDGDLIADIETALDKEIFARLNRQNKQSRDEIPERFDYLNKNDWITLSKTFHDSI